MTKRRIGGLLATALLVSCSNGAGSGDAPDNSTSTPADSVRTPADTTASAGEEVTSPPTVSAEVPATAAPIGPTGAVAPIAPSGERPYELFVTGVDVALRPGQSRVVPVTARNVGLEGAVWSIRTEDFRAPDGVTVSGLPASIDLTTEQQVVLMVEVTAAPTAAPGAFGRISVLFDDPTAPDVDRYTGSARIGIDIVDASGAVGPAAASDIIESPASGVVFDPTVNDTEGDAPLDPSTLTIVAPPLDGTLEVTQDIQLAYTPGPAGEDSAVYQICDTNNSCANATLTMYQTTTVNP